ncbi:hypothetical protein OAO01_04255 [Oligoflexia bacterium]|nr:hypothetical protein [Oligoflexia bacterium]
MISMYAPDAGLRIFCQNCFWGDAWDVSESAQEYDFSKSFFEQFAALLQKAPLVSLINVRAENSEYCNRIYDGRNNYLSYIALYSPENLIHTYYTSSCRDCVDICFSIKCELCYEVVNAENCYNCSYSARIRDCHSSLFLEDCIGCNNCIACKNLHRKSHHVFNQELSPTEYAAFLQSAQLDTRAGVTKLGNDFKTFAQQLPSRGRLTHNAEHSSGASLTNTKDCFECYDLLECEQCYFSVFCEKSHHLLDCFGCGEVEHSYDSVTLQNAQNIFFSATAIDSSNLLYCYECYANTQDCFGSIGLKRGKHCILNKAYTQREYEQKLEKIVDHMREGGEWGQFFPAELSPFAYNESTAFNEAPMRAEQCRQKGLRWSSTLNTLSSVENLVAAEDLPDHVGNLDELVQQAVSCKLSKHAFRFVRQELEFYQKHGIPLPQLHPRERHSARFSKIYPRRLYSAVCDCCQQSFDSSIDPQSGKLIYCEACFLGEFYGGVSSS